MVGIWYQTCMVVGSATVGVVVLHQHRSHLRYSDAQDDKASTVPQLTATSRVHRYDSGLERGRLANQAAVGRPGRPRGRSATSNQLAYNVSYVGIVGFGVAARAGPPCS